MVNKIEFPHNNEMYFNQAKEFLENNNYDKALESIKKVYENDISSKIIHLYTLILYTMEHYEEALEIIVEHKPLFLENEELTIFYVMVLIKNHQFIEAEAILGKHLIENKTSNYNIWKNLKTEFEIEKEHFVFNFEQKKKETKLALSELELYPIHKQNEIVLNAHQLSLLDLKEIAPRIFNHPFLNGMVKRAFLEILIEKNDESIYFFPWFNENKELVPKNVIPFSEDPILDAVVISLQDKLAKSPELFEPIYTEVLSDLLMLYPFIDEVITDVDYWVEYYISIANELTYNRSPKTRKQVEMAKWLERLNVNSQRIR